MATHHDPNLPNPDDLIAFFKEYRKAIVLVVVAIALIVMGTRSYFQVEADEEAVILRLGVPTGVAYGPGLHINFPFVDKVYIANVKKVHQLEFGFRTMRAGIQSEFDETSYQNESLMLTGDLALVVVQWTVFYRIADTAAYLFNVRNVEETIRDVSEAVMRKLVGDRSNDEVMTLHRAEIAQKAEEEIQVGLDRCNSGIHMERVALRQVEPPPAAQAAFNRVNEARARQQQVIEQAERGRVEAVELAIGQRNGVIAEARGKKSQEIETARGEAIRFLKFLDAYREAPGITRRWIYYDTMSRVLTKVHNKFLLSESSGGSDVVKLLPLADLMGAGGHVGRTNKAKGGSK